MPFDAEMFLEHGLTEGEKHFRRLVKAIERGEQPPAETLQFLANAGQRILDGDDPKSALQLKKKQGNKHDGFKVFRRIEIVGLICSLMDEKHLTKNKAIQLVADFMAGKKGYSIDSLERFYDEFHRSARKMNRANKVIHCLDRKQELVDKAFLAAITGSHDELDQIRCELRNHMILERVFGAQTPKI